MASTSSPVVQVLQRHGYYIKGLDFRCWFDTMGKLMNAYEFVFITKDGSKKVLETAEDIFKGFKGTIAAKEDWGKKAFTYKMKGLSEGFYHVWTVNMMGAEIKELKAKLNLEESIIRYLLLKKN
ncbi:MAG: 30S ribosomal protein S6 [Microgenomates bacterium OLB23]|nr:MAG: 30S ribosomal protein S6 [Microgenomates bacterium OLB23]